MKLVSDISARLLTCVSNSQCCALPTSLHYPDSIAVCVCYCLYMKARNGSVGNGQHGAAATQASTSSTDDDDFTKLHTLMMSFTNAHGQVMHLAYITVVNTSNYLHTYIILQSLLLLCRQLAY
jgi:hypothetical protein